MADVNGRNHLNHANGATVPHGFVQAPVSERSASPSRLVIAEATGREVIFGAEELLVSKTDLKGRITYANDAFAKIVGCSTEELLGQPHNVIRHPDMPRVVFNLLWQTIRAGKEIFAYVVNLTLSGDHYWVIAHVTPTFDAQGNVMGYHSNRRYAEPSAVAKVKGLYERLRAEERSHSRPTEAIAASQKVLDQHLAEAGLPYDEFVFTL